MLTIVEETAKEVVKGGAVMDVTLIVPTTVKGIASIHVMVGVAKHAQAHVAVVVWVHVKKAVREVVKTPVQEVQKLVPNNNYTWGCRKPLKE